MPERLLTVQEAGEMLNTGERFPRRLIAERRIRFVRVGRHVRIPESASGLCRGTDGRGNSIARGALMANKTGHRRFGSVHRRSSGRWQARYEGPDGLTRSAQMTFDSKRSAEQWLTLMEGRILRGEWQPPEQSKIIFGHYATHWVADRRLEPRSRELYAMLLRLHIMPWFNDVALDRITPPIVRLWRTDLLRQGRSESTAAKSYRLLRAILNTAVKDDRLLRENPCRMRRFDKEPTSERPTASVDQVWRLAALMPRRLRAQVIFAAFTGLRWGELVALRARDVDLDTGVVHLVRKFAELPNGKRVPGRPKSDAGFRTVALPSVLVAVVREHLAEFLPSARKPADDII
jgi:excisionase family DNA binding protein